MQGWSICSDDDSDDQHEEGGQQLHHVDEGYDIRFETRIEA